MVSVYAIDNDDESLLYSYTTGVNGNTVSFGGHTITTDASYSDIFGDSDDPIGQEGVSTISENGKTSYAYKFLDEDGKVTSDSMIDNITDYSIGCTYTYDDSDKLVTQTYNHPYFPNQISYQYNENDEIVQVDSQGCLDEYTYGTHGQLAWYDQSTMFRSINYQYDERGNVTSRKSYAWKSMDEADLDTADYFYYTSNTWEDQLTAVNNSPITYDDSGNISSYNGYTYTWENGRQLKSVSNGVNTYTYTYDENGYRTSKTINGNTINYINHDGKILAEYNDYTYRVYWYDSDGSILGYITGFLDRTDAVPQTYFYKKNQMGDIIGLTSDTYSPQGEYVYDAWGKVVMVTDGGQEVDWDLEAYLNPFRYRGYYYDNETGFYYLQSRYYNPEWHRFINADDPNKIGETQTPLSVNAYAYCENDPINLTDETGCASISLVGVGLQIELSVGRGTVGTELIWYTKSSIHKGRARYMPYVYLYTDFGIINQQPSDITGLVNKLSRSPALINSGKYLVKSKISASVCVFAVFGYGKKFTRPSDYKGEATGISVTLWNVKTYTSFGSKCFTVGVGVSTAKFSASNNLVRCWLTSKEYKETKRMQGVVNNTAKEIDY